MIDFEQLFKPALIFSLIAAIWSVGASAPAETHAEIKIPSQKATGELQPVAFFNDAMPTGVTISDKGRIFVNFPRWGDNVAFTVAELIDGKAVAYPNAEMNRALGPAEDPDGHFVSVQSVVVDPKDRLWILDTGSVRFGPVTPGAARLFCVDLTTNKIVQAIVIPAPVAHTNSYLNDVRFDLTRGKAGYAFITDSSSKGPNGLIVVDLARGESFRRLDDHPSVRPVTGFLPVVEGKPLLNENAKGEKEALRVGSDGIAIGADGKQLFYCPLSSRKLYSVGVDALLDRGMNDEAVSRTVCEVAEKGASDGLESDSQGRIYAGDYEHNAIHRLSLSGEHETIVCDPRVLWPDTLSLGGDGYLYFIANQLHRQPGFHGGKDMREKPYVLFRVKVDAQPVRLR